MKLLTQELRRRLPPLYSQENTEDPTVHCKFFTPDSSWTWLATEGSEEKGDFRFFGYVIGLEEGMLPFRRREDTDSDTEEERRLLFVGMTRARQRLTLSHARYRMLRGAALRTVRSPFLDELPCHEIEWRQVGMDAPRRRRAMERDGLPDDIEQWQVGTLVQHPDHGIGRIVSIRRGSAGTLVDVQARNGSAHTWVLEFSKLKRVDFDEIGDVTGSMGA